MNPIATVKSHARSTILLLTLALTACGGGSSAASPPTTTTTIMSATTTTISSAAVWVKQNAHVISSIDPAQEDYSDLKSFGDAVGDARIVALSETDHGSGSVFDMKTRLVKYLHEKKGFDVLMIESSLFAVNRIGQLVQQGQKVDDLASGNIFYMYSKSAEGRKVLQYVDAQRSGAHPLTLSSFETSGTNASNESSDLFPMLETFLSARGSAINGSVDWDTYKNFVLNSVITSQDPSPTQDNLLKAGAVSTKLVAELCAAQDDSYVFPTSPGIWCLVVKGLSSAADGKFGHYSRDVVAAANFKWLDDHIYAGRKIIVWSHYMHSGRGTQSPVTGGPTNMGSEMNNIYGKQMYVAAFTSSKGSELAWWNGAATSGTFSVEADRTDGLEAALQAVGAPTLFLDARNTSPPASVTFLPAKVANFFYTDVINTKLGDAYDGVFYIETSVPAVMNR